MIKINTKVINLDVSKKLYEKLVAKQGDIQSRFLLFNLSSNGAAINLTNRSVRVYAVKPDSTEVFNDLVVSDPARGTCILELTNQMLSIPGTVKMELMVTEGTKKLTSFEFELEVVKKLNSETSIVSTNEFTALINGLASLSEYDNYKNEIKSARGSFLSLLARLNDSDTKKVDKVTGKGLSTNDYDNTEKSEVAKVKNKAENIDNGRTTDAKDVTGAINELNLKAKINTCLNQLTGWEKDPNTGLVEQWGYVYGLSATENTITLPIVMNDNNYNVSLTEYSGPELGVGGIKLTQVTTTSFKVKPGTTPVSLYWRAKGWV